jgi:HEAT repeat protein/beta-lactamase regulating signal transducer with metallopeptidase domain
MDRISEFALGFVLNAAWQIAVIALIAWMCSRLLRSAAARYRHALWVAALVLSLALPVWGLLDLTGEAKRHTAKQQTEFAQTPENLTSAPHSRQDLKIAPAQPSALTLGQLLQRRRQPIVTAPSLPLLLALGYALFILYRSGVLWRSWRRTRELRRSTYAREIPARMNLIVERCRNALGRRNVHLVCSAEVAVPVTIGTRAPLIILPESFFSELPDETLVSVLGHEMAHIARRDYALNLVYEFLLLPISFHPLAGFIRRQIDRTRELACDEMVTERLLEPKLYAHALVRVADTLVSPAGQAFTLGIFDADILEERIMKLTQNRRRLGKRTARLLALTTFTLLCLSSLAISTFSFELRTSRGIAGAEVNHITMQAAANAPVDLILSQSRINRDAQEGRGSASTTTRAEGGQGLVSVDAQERAREACEAGRRRALEAIPKLISMLGDDSPIQPLKCWDSGRWNPALETFRQPSPGEEAAIALASMGTPALEPLTNALTDSNSSVRRNAAWAIGELTDMRKSERDSAVTPLISLVKDSDEWVRMAAIRALGEIRDKRAVENLISALSDASSKVRELGAWALGEMKEERAVPTLCGMLLEDAQAEVRETAAWALGEIRSPQAVASLNQALNDPETRVRDKARWALSEIEDNDG